MESQSELPSQFKLIHTDQMTMATASEISCSQTLDAQVEQEQACFDCLRAQLLQGEQLILLREEHIDYLSKRLQNLPASFSGLDASQAWLAYWSVHALHLLGEDLDAEVASTIANVLASMQCRGGGFGGGPHQVAHLAVTYAAVNCLCILRRLDIVDRPALSNWLKQLKQPDGSFRMQLDGEVDVRGVYCAASAARLLSLPDFADLFAGTTEWLAACQTYEGGFGGVPGSEAHGGYAFCAFAALCILGRPEACDSKRLLRWAALRQMPFEGGFQGRTNKLVDSCYSFWVGALFPCLQTVLASRGEANDDDGDLLFDRERLQAYVLGCCQKRSGGIYDKPPGSPDPYHCCYALSGLSIAQHGADGGGVGGPAKAVYVSGQRCNQLRVTDPWHNIGSEFVPSNLLPLFRSAAGAGAGAAATSTSPAGDSRRKDAALSHHLAQELT